MDKTGFTNINFDMPKNQSNVIKVIGVGGGGSNAINHMFQQGIKGVDFVICNTDAQALENSAIPNKIQLGVGLTEGLGAGANPEIGEQAAIESLDDIKRMLEVNTKMVFITAGMGGGTGTGAAPVIAKLAKDMDILTVAIVTAPFKFEGRMRDEQAKMGIEKLRSQVDSLIVINNNKLREVYGNLGFKAGFSKADEVLATASKGIAEVITHHYTQNIDLRDAKTVLSNSGTAIMGAAHASGANRAKDAITKALDSPLLNDNKILGAKNVLLLIVSGKEEITIDEIGEISDYIQEEAGHSANIIMGVGEEPNLDSGISVTVIATGFNIEQQDDIVNTESKKIIHSLSDDQKVVQELSVNNTSTSINTSPRLQSNHGYSEITSSAKPERNNLDEKVIIRHNLMDDTEAENETPELIPTTDFIKNIKVEAVEEVRFSVSESVDNADEEFVFVEVDAQEKTAPVNIPVSDTDSSLNKDTDTENWRESEQIVFEDKNQMTINFDMPLIDNKSSITTSSSSSEEPKVVVHRLESEPTTKEVYKSETPLVSPTMQVKKATQNSVSAPVISEEDLDKIDPLNHPVSSLTASVAERRAKMKALNYRFNHKNTNIDEIEKQPAYKRAGVNLEDPDTDSNISRTTLTTDSNNEMQLRKRNSFLHDNVD